jgi:hypothetical protein
MPQIWRKQVLATSPGAPVFPLARDSRRGRRSTREMSAAPDPAPLLSARTSMLSVDRRRDRLENDPSHWAQLRPANSARGPPTPKAQERERPGWTPVFQNIGAVNGWTVRPHGLQPCAPHLFCSTQRPGHLHSPPGGARGVSRLGGSHVCLPSRNPGYDIYRRSRSSARSGRSARSYSTCSSNTSPPTTGDGSPES